MRHKFLRWAILSSFLLCSAVLTVFAVRGENSTKEAPRVDPPSVFTGLNITGLSYSNYDPNGKLISRIRADQLAVRPRSFGVFRIKSVNELTIENPRFDLFALENVREEVPSEGLSGQLSSGIKGLTELKGMGRVTRCRLAGLTVARHVSGHPDFILQARETDFDLRGGDLVLTDVILEHPPSGEKILASQAFWKESVKAFLIPGKYLRESPQIIQEGESISIDLEWNILPLVISRSNPS